MTNDGQANAMKAKAWFDVGLRSEEIEEAKVTVQATLLGTAATFKGDPVVAAILLNEDLVSSNELSWLVRLAD